MKNGSLLSVLGLGLALGLGFLICPVGAQTFNAVTVTLSHPVAVGSVTLPAGQVKIVELNGAGTPAALGIGVAGGPSVIAMANRVETATHALAAKQK
jgi:hypothetical protein